MKFDTLAKALCKKSDHRQHHHSVVVVNGGSIVALGHNFNSIHAEVNALKKLWPDHRRGVKVYSFRFTKGGKWGMAKPCKKCQEFMIANGVKTVYYTSETGEMKRMKL